MNHRERTTPSDQESKQPAARVALVVIMFAVLMTITCVVSGRWSYHLVSDTASYLQYSFSSASAAAKEIRTPVYPVVLRLFQWVSPNQSAALQLVTFAQILLHAVASAALFVELRNWKIGPRFSLAIAATVAVGCTFWDNVSTIATDCPAMSLGVLCGVLVLSGWRCGFSKQRIAMLGVCVVLTVGLRPAYLFLIPWAAGCALLRPSGATPTLPLRRLRDAALIIAIPVVAVLGWCVFRYSAAGDFSILPFGHQNMAAVTTQLLDNDELKSIPGRVGKLASEIADLRVAVSQGKATADETLPPGTRLLSADGLDLRTSSDPALRAESFMTLENRWDAMTYLVVVPAAAKVIPDDTIAQHQLLAELDKQIVLAYPTRYVRWWLLAVRRGMWGSAANMAMHPLFLISITAFALFAIYRCVSPMARPDDPGASSTCDAGYRALVLLAFTYAAFKLGFVALTSPPIGRFSDAAFVFIPGVLLCAAFAILQQIRQST